MPRKPRILVDGMALHIVQRGVDRAATFFDTDDYLLYLELLQEAAELYGLRVHSYCLMTNHIHLLLTPTEATELAPAMKRLTQVYVQRINRLYNRSGPLWSGRYKATLVGSDRYLLSCYRYIELNPVRASMVSHAAEYQWSSYKFNSGSCPSALIEPHPAYIALGRDLKQRHLAYKSLFDDALTDVELNQIRDATRQSVPLGDSMFVAEIEAMMGRRLALRRPGRPSLVEGRLRRK